MLRGDSHAEIDQLDAIDPEVFESSRFVADVQAVFVRAIRLGGRGLDGNPFVFAIGDHFAAAWEFQAELLDPPGSDHSHVRIERRGGQLEAALIVPFARRTMGVGVGLHLAGNLQANFRDERPSDRRAEQIRAFVLRLPLEHRKREVAAQLLLSIDNPGRCRAALPGFRQNRVAILARLTEIDVHRVDVVAFVLEPAEND